MIMEKDRQTYGSKQILCPGATPPSNEHVISFQDEKITSGKRTQLNGVQ